MNSDGSATRSCKAESPLEKLFIVPPLPLRRKLKEGHQA